MTIEASQFQRAMRTLRGGLWQTTTLSDYEGATAGGRRVAALRLEPQRTN